MSKQEKLFPNNNEIQFEEALEELEDIVGQLESGDLNLKESLEQFSEGVKLIKFCQGELDEAEEKVEMVIKNNKDELSDIVPFKEEEE
jgi:exodeoxyribonuclease VII small subunit